MDEITLKPGERITIIAVEVDIPPDPLPEPPVDPVPVDDDLEFLEPQPNATVLPKSTVRLLVPADTEKVNVHVRLPKREWTLVATLTAAPWEAPLDLAGFPGAIELQATARAGTTQIDRVIIPVTVSATPDPEPEEPPLEEPVAGQACPAWVHPSYQGAWHPPIDPASGCLIGHEHGDDPDPTGHFAAYGVPPINLNDLLAIYDVHLAKRGKQAPEDRCFHTEAYKLQVQNTGKPTMLGRLQFININDNRLIAWGQPPYVKDRNDAWEWSGYIPIRANLLGPDGLYIDFRAVMGIAAVHAKSSAVEPFDKQAFVDLHKRDPERAAEVLRSGNRGVAFYLTPFSSDKKRGHEFVSIDGKPIFSLAFTYRNVDSTAIENGSMREELANTPWHTSTLRWTSRMAMGALCRPGIFWTDIYGQKLLGTGPNTPNTAEYAVRQVIGFTSGVRNYIWEDNPENALISGTRVSLYDAPGVAWPN